MSIMCMFKYFDCFKKKSVDFRDEEEVILVTTRDNESIMEDSSVSVEPEMNEEETIDESSMLVEPEMNVSYCDQSDNTNEEETIDESSMLVEPEMTISYCDQSDNTNDNESGNESGNDDYRVNSPPTFSLENLSLLDTSTSFEIPLTKDAKSPMRPGTPIPGFKKNDE